ncbi:MAG: acylphosphatase [Patescibacteria group bacterium]
MFKQAHIFVSGNVIGVGFRAWVKYQSKFTNVSGWVRNVGDEVEVLLQGEEKNILDMIERIKKGPPISNVKNVEINWEEIKEKHTSFEILK